jgi:hypothetical protein
VLYNRKRRHASLGYVSPAVYEEMHEMKQGRAASLANQVSAICSAPQDFGIVYFEFISRTIMPRITVELDFQVETLVEVRQRKK